MMSALSACIEWHMSKDRYGYGMQSRGGRVYRAHRLAYEEAFGPIPDGLQIDHLCRNRSCVNPEHLEAVTQLENARRGIIATKTHCKHGHEFTPENTYRKARGHRQCRACACEWSRRYRQRKGFVA